MKTRILLTVLVAAFLFTTTNVMAETVTLRLADQFPLTHFASKTGSQAFIKQVDAMSNKTITIKHFPAQQLAKASGMLDAVKNRVADIAVCGVVYVSDRMPLSGAAMLPGLFNDVTTGTRAYTKLANKELLEAEFLRHGVRPLWVSLAPVYQLQLVSKESITSLDDIKGKKLRTAGAIMELTAKSLGATPVTIGPSDFYLSLQRGTVDGAIYTIPGWRAYSLHEVLNSSTDNAALGSVAFATLINEDVWQGLSPEVQSIMQKAGDKTGADAAAIFDNIVAKSNQKMKEAGKNIYSLSPEVLKEMSVKLTTVEKVWLDQMKSRKLPGDKILEAFKRYLNEE
jgi:TRAP-type C4-dicarboxylate transport system substrate-binding protein